MITKNNPYRPKGKINILLLPLILLISVLLLTAPAKAPNVELQALEQEVSRLIADKDAFRANPESFSAEEIRRLKERKVRLEARILESAEMGLISLDDESRLIERLESWALMPLTESERVWPSLQGRYDAILAAARDAYFRYGGQNLLERLRPILERYNRLKERVRNAYYAGHISEAQRDELISRIEQEQSRISQDIANLEGGSKGSVAPKPAPPQKTSSSEASTAEEPADLSGTWQEMEGNKAVGKWEIKADKSGKIILRQLAKKGAGKVVEFSGSIKGDDITARHYIKDPDVIDSSIPRKVREALADKYNLTWDLHLKVSEERTTLKGKRIGFQGNYNTKTLKINWVKQGLEKPLVLKKKIECADLLSQLRNAIQAFYNALGRRDRPLMIKAKQRVEALQRSLKSQKPLPKGCERLPQFVSKVLKRMDAYINPPKEARGKGPPGDGVMLPPDTAVVGGSDAASEQSGELHDEVARLTEDLINNWESASGQQASDAVRGEAGLIARLIIWHINRRHDVDGWGGGWDTNFMVGIRETAEDWGISSLAGSLSSFHGKCYEWADTLTGAFNEIGRLHYFRGAHIWQPGDPDTGVGTHHAFAIYRNGGSYDEGLVIDPWRNDGLPFWCPVSEDHYNWLNFPRRN